MMALALTAARAPTDDALVGAIRAGDVTGAQAALAHHADPNRRLAFGTTPLALAADAQDAAMVELLLARGARPNAADADGVTPLLLACERGKAAIVLRLIAARADVRAAEPDGTTPLAVCARFGPVQAVAAMLAGGAPADSLDDRGQTPLMWAAAAGRADSMALLLKAGAGVNRVSKRGFTPLLFAVKSGDVPATELLLAAGADPAFRGPERTSAAQLAVYQRHWPIAALFVARGGVDLAERDRTGMQLLHAAAAGGDEPLVDLLLAKGADVNALTGPSRISWRTEANFGVAPAPVPPLPPLLLAAANGHPAVMKRLLAAGADPRFVAADGTNVVLAATGGGSAAALAIALSLAPDANVARADGATPLHLLAGGNPTPDLEPMLRLLAAHGARADIANRRGASAAALADGNIAEVKAIFRKTFPAGGVRVAARLVAPHADPPVVE